MEANEYLLQENNSDKKEDGNDHHNPPSGNGSGDSGKTEESENKGTKRFKMISNNQISSR